MSKPTGGKLIEISSVSTPFSTVLVARLWVVCTYDGGPPELAPEHCVCVRVSPRMPELGEHIWWRDDRVYFGDTNEMLAMVGTSFPAPSMAGEE